MLDKEEKKEMLMDAKSIRRRKFFQLGMEKKTAKISFDEYLSFLDSIQKIFSPFKTSTGPTLAKFNKL
ncbi:MAG: hypothetical protein A3I73_02605 [Omnitrophica bacterium RIFCSPLOWO2_02_FULL_45_16]|nr:MAG: hypothetical protein A3K16_06145 [Omnitrophica bacterium RIFCSPLOWO2_01_FULL_45_24]OGW94800.1 MAG: hypothetical protein A3G36_03400 [Omnitrophica bacterium RIFCSPLOWO2_12_FULL_45_13]OGX01399.1 MAG: hypothetical protein A3I73_02605 [Omnitrophica bacterium RIFCSPLOWO2_02_FULL_45_16]